MLCDRVTGERLGTGVLGRGVPARPAQYVEPRRGSPPTPCAAHPEPFSCVDVSVWRGAEKSASWGGVDVARDNRQDSNPLRLGASAEARLAWSKPSSASDQICKPSRSAGPRVALFSAPRSQSRARPSRAVLRLCSCHRQGCRVPTCPGGCASPRTGSLRRPRAPPATSSASSAVSRCHRSRSPRRSSRCPGRDTAGPN